MAVNTDRLVVRGKNQMEFARYVAGVLGAYVAITPRGAVTVTDSRATQTYTDWSAALGSIAAQASDGDRTVGLSFTAFLIPSDAAFQDMNEAYEGNETVAFRLSATERVGTESFVKAYKGFLTTFSYTLNQDGAAEVSISFVASDVIAVPATP